MGIVELSLVPGAEEECLIHTDAVPVNLKCRRSCLGVCSEKIVNIQSGPVSENGIGAPLLRILCGLQPP